MSFIVTDGHTTSTAATRGITITPVNDAPTVTAPGATPTYTEGGAAVTIDNTITVTDPDDTQIESGQVRISADFQTGDTLNFTNQNGISGAYNSGTGVLTLTGSASEADYQTALRSITFSSTNIAPTASKTIEFKVNDGDTDSNLALQTVNITAVNDPPVVDTSAGTTANTENLLSVDRRRHHGHRSRRHQPQLRCRRRSPPACRPATRCSSPTRTGSPASTRRAPAR